MSTDAAIPLDEEAIQVTHWRVQRFLELGFTVRQARMLAAAQADWHVAQGDLLDRGCDREIAFRLLV